MPAAPLSCPYCNALVPLPAGARSGQRLPCPRCGEAFAYHGPDAEAVSPTPPALPPNRLDLSAGPALAAGRRRPNWLVAAGVLGVMAVMALAGLLYALNTEGVRREHDWRLPKDRSLPLYLTVFAGLWLAGLVGVALWELQSRCRRGPDGGPRRVPWGVALGVVTVVAAAGVGLAVLAVRINENRASRPALPDAPPVRAVAPADLAGLGYLPEGTDVVAAAHVAEALQEPTGKEFLARFRFGETGVGLGTVEGWTGLKPEELDHVVLGVKAEGVLMPGWLVLVVRTRRPYDAEKRRDALRASRLPREGRKELYRVKPEGASVEPVLWCADEHTLVLGLGVTDLQRVPAEPRQGIDHLPPEVRAYLKERLGQGTQAWVVGHVADWKKTFVNLWLARPLKENPESAALLAVRTFGVAFQFRAEELTFNANLKCADERSAEALEKFFRQPKAERKRPGITALPPDLAAVSRELGERMKSVREGDWLMFQSRTRAETLQKGAATPPR